jgi:hypothetical protein
MTVILIYVSRSRGSRESEKVESAKKLCISYPYLEPRSQGVKKVVSKIEFL